jgi:hypothetical protein
VNPNLRFRRALATLALAVTVAFAAGCDDDDNGTNPIPEGAGIRVIHASPDAPAVDVYAAGSSTALFTNVAYGEVTSYKEVVADTVKIELRPAGAAPSTPPVYTTGALAIAEDAKITAIAAGLIGSTDPDDSFRILPLVEGFADPGTSARVRIVHAGADAPAVALDVANDGTPEVTDFARFEETGPAGVELPAGTPIAIGVWAGAPLARVTAFTTPALPAGGELFVIATGLLSRLPRETAGFSLLAVGPSGAVGFIKQDPVLYALHASPDAPAVDIGLSGTSTNLVADLAFGELSAPVQVQPGTYSLDFRPAGSTTVAATATTPALAAGERYLAVATGFLAPDTGEEAFQLVPIADEFDLELVTPVLRVAHESPDAPAVDVGTVVGNVFTAIAPFSNLSFPGTSVATGTAVGAAALTLGIAPTGTTTPVATFNVTTASGMRAIALAAGALTPGVGDQTFRLLIVQTAAWPWTVATVNPN